MLIVFLFIIPAVLIAISVNSEKKRFIDAEEMQKAIVECIENGWGTPDRVDRRCFVGINSQLTVAFCRANEVKHLIRGLRDGVDYGYEERIAKVNKEIAGIDTIYFRADQFGYISSSMVRELLKFNEDVRKFIPLPIWNILKKG